MDKVWTIKDPDEYLKPKKKKTSTRDTPIPRNEKDPARAYTLSLLFWGAGQNYNQEHGKGLFFNIALIMAVLSIILALIFGDSVILFLRSRGLSPSDLFLGAEILYFCTLIFWRYNAGDAYHVAARTRRTRFKGVSNTYSPFFSSLLIPGWGQFLNGQPVKGSLYSGFSVLALLSFVSIPATLLLWPFLEVSESRMLIETIFGVAVLYTPIIPFVWLFGGFDAWRVSRDELKKEPLLERIKSANNRRRTQGWVQGVFPGIWSTLLLVLTLAALVLFVGAVAERYYLEQLSAAGAWMQRQGMTVVPDVIERLLRAVSHAA